jgi:hypothetical protein
MRWPLKTPVPSSWTVRDAVSAYLEENGFDAKDYDAPTALLTPFGISMHIPNPPSRQRAVRLHDLHHLVTGFGTDFDGEAEVSAWELSRGLRGLGLYIRLIILGAFMGGMLVSPRRTWRAFRAAPTGDTLFPQPSYEKLINLTLGELRQLLGVSPNGIAQRPRGLHLKAPKPVNSSAQCLEK